MQNLFSLAELQRLHDAVSARSRMYQELSASYYSMSKETRESYLKSSWYMKLLADKIQSLIDAENKL